MTAPRLLTCALIIGLLATVHGSVSADPNPPSSGGGSSAVQDAVPARIEARIDTLIHPRCLEPLGLFRFSEATLAGEAFSCAFETLEPVNPRDDGWVYADRPRTREGDPTGYIGYRAHSVTSTQGSTLEAWLDVTANGGGNAEIRSIWQLRIDTATGLIEPQMGLLGGDRCNGGQLAIQAIDGSQLTYSGAATPYRLLNPPNLNPASRVSGEGFVGVRDQQSWPEHRRENFLGWPFVGVVSDCYACCVGEWVKTWNTETQHSALKRVLIQPDATLDDFFEHPAIIACAKDWWAELKAQGEATELADGRRRLVYSFEQWQAHRDALQQHCQDVIPPPKS